MSRNKCQQWQTEISELEEWNQLLQEEANKLIILEIYSSWFGYTNSFDTTIDALMKKIKESDEKMLWKRMNIVRIINENNKTCPQLLDKFKDFCSPRPLFLFIKDKKLLAKLKQCNSVLLNKLVPKALNGEICKDTLSEGDAGMPKAIPEQEQTESNKEEQNFELNPEHLNKEQKEDQPNQQNNENDQSKANETPKKEEVAESQTKQDNQETTTQQEQPTTDKKDDTETTKTETKTETKAEPEPTKDEASPTEPSKLESTETKTESEAKKDEASPTEPSKLESTETKTESEAKKSEV